MWASDTQHIMQGSIQWGGGGGASTPNSLASTPKKFQLQYKLLWSRPYLSVNVYLEWSKMASNATLYNLKTQISPREACLQIPLVSMYTPALHNIYGHAQTHTHTHTHTHTRACTHAHTHMCTHVYIQALIVLEGPT